MQALKDAGILLAALTLLVSVSVSRVADDGEAAAETSLTPRTEAAVPAETAPAEVAPAFFRAAPRAVPADAPPVEAGTGRFEIRFDGDLAQRCEEVLVLLADVAAERGRDAVAHRIHQVVKQQPCPKT